MQSVAAFLVAFGPFGLTMMAGAMAVWPPSKRGLAHWIWLIAIVVVGLPTSWATYINSQASDRTTADTNLTAHAVKDALAKQKIRTDQQYKTLSGQYGSLTGQYRSLSDEYDGLNRNYGKIVTALHLRPSDPIDQILAKLEKLAPQTLTVSAGSTFVVPAISGEVSVYTAPNQPTTIKLPLVPLKGEEITVKDSGGNAGNGGSIKVDGNGKLIDGHAIEYLQVPHQANTYKFDGTSWGNT